MAALADELFLLGYDGASGKPLVATSYLDLGLGGALLLDLVLREQVMLDGDRVRAAASAGDVADDVAGTGDALLDAALDKIRDEANPRKPEHWVRRLSKGTRDAVQRRLVDAGVLRLEEHKVLGLIPLRRMPEVDGRIEAELMGRLREVVLSGAAPDDRTAAIVSLALACGLERHLFPGADRRAVVHRMQLIAEGEWAGAAVNKAVAAVNAAVIAAVVAGGMAATAGAG